LLSLVARMPRVLFTANLQRHVPCPPCTVPGSTAREALENAFALTPRVRGYVLDEHGELRRHMVVFVNGRACADRSGLTDTVGEGDQVVVMQALSGG
jgi:molybdopterin converting factor small subunit